MPAGGVVVVAVDWACKVHLPLLALMLILMLVLVLVLVLLETPELKFPS